MVFLGFGDVASAVYPLLRGRRCVATTRSEGKVAYLERRGIEPRHGDPLVPAMIDDVVEGAWVLVSFPPDEATDLRIAPSLERASRVVYVSSTAVYGATRGRIDDSTRPAPDDARGQRRLDAEALYLARGAVVLRAPGLYGPGTGLHVRLRSGTFRMAGDGNGVISRLHLDDMARLVVAAFESDLRGEALVVADLCPVPQREVIAYLCQRLGLEMPPRAPIEQVSPTLRGSRSIDPRGALARLGVTLAYPSYREGFEQAIEAEARAMLTP